jgi:Fe-S-cluster-containing dehydrogenase component/CRP-like cAMP-binding protein
VAEVAILARPQRWDAPFGTDMTDAAVERLLALPEIAAIEAAKFPTHMPLAGILKNDTRLVRFGAGDIVVREGDYGNSAFLVVSGRLRVVLAPDLPRELIGRQVSRKKTFFGALSQLWRNSHVAEVRDTRRYQKQALRGGEGDLAKSQVFLQDVPAILDQHKTAVLDPGALFGELAALGRIPRTATIFAEGDAELIEIRWQGLRELRKYDAGWRRRIDERYRENALKVALHETPLFRGLKESDLQEVANATLFETYGSFDWHVSYQRMRDQGKAEAEPIIAREGEYPDGALLVRAGFARVSVAMGNGRRTLTYLGAGDVFGFDELWQARNGADVSLMTTLSALGYVDLLRVPAPILAKFVFPKITKPPPPLLDLAAGPIAHSAPMEWAVEQRFINGTKAMVIDLNRCVRCDDCVRACAATHDNNPRFIRHGQTFDNWMVANACMHCADPVCMIGCPTGAIHRSIASGAVTINDDTCIGCGTCASSCPYDNIRLVEIRDRTGQSLRDPDTQKPILKATKCDLCETNPGGPACVRACPHDALKRIDFRSDQTFERPR